MASLRLIGALALLVASLANTTRAEPEARSPAKTPEAAASDPKEDFEWLVIPNSETNTDRGIGGGVFGLFFWYGDNGKAFRDRIEVGLTVTTKLHQNHYVIWERLGLFEKPLRLRVKLGFLSTRDHNYCGIGNQVTCDESEAEQQASAAGLTEGTEAYDEFVSRYYVFGAKRPYIQASLRRGFESTPRLELALGWKAVLELSGTFDEDGPYPGSLYAEEFPDGEEELLQVVETGLVFDSRDNEIHPSDGQLAAAYARAAWGIAGFNENDRHFAGATLNYGRFDSLGSDSLVWANRVALDALVGDVPTRELGEIGGFWATTVFGGGFGRGVRANRFIGKVKLGAQSELRWRSKPVYRRARALLNVFLDAGWVGASVRRVGGEATRVLYSGGIGPGVSWGRSFVARLDIGVSDYESYSPFVYLRIGHPF